MTELFKTHQEYSRIVLFFNYFGVVIYVYYKIIPLIALKKCIFLLFLIIYINNPFYLTLLLIIKYFVLIHGAIYINITFHNFLNV